MSTDNNVNPWADIPLEEEGFRYEEDTDTGSETNSTVDEGISAEPPTNSVASEEEVERFAAPTESDNLAFLIAQDLLKRGFIDPSFEIPDNVDDQSVLELIEESGLRKASAMYEDYLYKQGINDKNINILRALENGATQEEIKEVVSYQKYADMSPEEHTKEEKLAMIGDYLKGRGWADYEIKDRLEVIEYDDDKFSKDFESGKNFFKSQVQEYNNYQLELTKQKEAYERQIQEHNTHIMERAFREGVIYNERMTPKEIEVLKQQVFNKSYPMEMGDGNVVNVSPFEAFMYDITNNLETQLYMFKLATFREVERKLMEEEAEKKAEGSFLQKFKRDTLVDKGTEITNSNSPKRKVYNVSGG
jgi:hypothetical protein